MCVLNIEWVISPEDLSARGAVNSAANVRYGSLRAVVSTTYISDSLLGVDDPGVVLQNRDATVGQTAESIKESKSAEPPA